jgi:hypothetical protein
MSCEILAFTVRTVTARKVHHVERAPVATAGSERTRRAVECDVLAISRESRSDRLRDLLVEAWPLQQSRYPVGIPENCRRRSAQYCPSSAARKVPSFQSPAHKNLRLLFVLSGAVPV